MKTVIFILTLLILTMSAQAETKIVFKNKCPDINQAELTFVESIQDPKLKQSELSRLYSCLNKSQACQSDEVKAQVKKACKGIKCQTVYSIDPIRTGKWKEGLEIDQQRNLSYQMGAWKKNGKIQFACNPGCPSAWQELRRLQQ